MESWTKICPFPNVIKYTDGNQKCIKESCALWDGHYNCCAILSSSILLETLVKRKSRYWPKKEDFSDKAEENAGGK
ncbi:MAG: hypothetical protein QMD94_04480 [Candidatus Omnitrophota bacterium]|nr:hypothetical protein [Candidatus Omnitrophota bacterium]